MTFGSFYNIDVNFTISPVVPVIALANSNPKRSLHTSVSQNSSLSVEETKLV